MVTQDNNSDVHKSYVSLTARIYVIYHVYTMYIPCIYHVYTSHMTVRARFVAHARLAASDWDFLQVQIFSVLVTERPPWAGADLVNMAAPPRGRASTIGTAALKSVQLSAAVLMWNS
jgi:hypothetical protein